MTSPRPAGAVLAALAAAVAMVGPSQAAPSGALSCAFDGLSAPDRLLVGRVIGALTTDRAEAPAAEAKTLAAAATCRRDHGWDEAREILAVLYAASRTAHDAHVRILETAQVRTAVLDQVWSTLSAQDRLALAGDEFPAALATRMREQFKAAGVPDELTEQKSAYTALAHRAEIGRLEADWAKP